MTLLVATRSVGKQREFARILEPLGVTLAFPDDVGLAPRSDEDALELGDTFEANARHKAEYFARRSGLATVADDSGLEVLALGGAPGVRSRRWAGATGTPDQVDAANNAELVRRLAGAPPARRGARYRCVLVLLREPGAIPESFEGSCAGRILEQPAGTGGFGYDPYFFSDELQKSFGEATPEEKDGVSHRGRAVRGLAAALERRPVSA
ncbi:MAG TPA: non-canonical purine NTP pyrophosphatase [Gemmatimonadales bacterium]|nr:non-canonical purine NTP pyrophosphatase [Gemmatimonadales bacterium]